MRILQRVSLAEYADRDSGGKLRTLPALLAPSSGTQVESRSWLTRGNKYIAYFRAPLLNANAKPLTRAARAGLEPAAAPGAIKSAVVPPKTTAPSRRRCALIRQL